VEKTLKEIEACKEVIVEPLTGLPILQVKIRQDVIARHGVPAKDVLDLVEALGSVRVSEVVEGQYRFPLVVRLPEKYRGTVTGGEEACKLIEELPVITPRGERLPLSRLAEVTVLEDTPSTISRDWGQRRITIGANVKDGHDLGSFVAEAQRRITAASLGLNGRYHLEWGGQWQHLISARQRLYLVVPLALVLIFSLIYMTYGNVVDTIRVFTGVPFAAVGGVFALWLRDMPFSISAAIGFIAMSGVAVLDDMILVSYIRQLRERGLPLDIAVRQAALTRLRPVLMTTLVACLGFVPMAISTGMGAEVQRPLATVVIGGVLSAMIMSLFVIRVLYVIFRSPVDIPKNRNEGSPSHSQSDEFV
jgi:cobalt-zinc-cadmium resistance protein CzcA